MSSMSNLSFLPNVPEMMVTVRWFTELINPVIGEVFLTQKIMTVSVKWNK